MSQNSEPGNVLKPMIGLMVQGPGVGEGSEGEGRGKYGRRVGDKGVSLDEDSSENAAHSLEVPKQTASTLNGQQRPL